MKKYIKEIIILVLFILISWKTNASMMEIVASLTGLMCVWWTAEESIWNYPPGFINVILFGIIFYQAHLYADMTLQIIFGFLMIMGVYIWLTKREGNNIRPTRVMTFYEKIMSIVALIIITIGWGFLLKLTNDSIPFLDAFVATLSILGQYFLSKKVLGNWWFWIVTDIFSIGMYIYKGLPVIAFTYVVFLIIAIFGLVSWKKEYNAEKA